LILQPILGLLSEGLRDVPDDKEFLQRLDVWTQVQELRFDPANRNEVFKDTTYGISQLLLEDGMQMKYDTSKKDKNPTLEGLELGDVLFPIEHFLEVHIAGKIVLTAFELNFKDESWMATLSILRLILNHSNNLAWAPKWLNDNKTKFLKGLFIFFLDKT
jgi:hypothetical protein